MHQILVEAEILEEMILGYVAKKQNVRSVHVFVVLAYRAEVFRSATGAPPVFSQ